MYIEGRLKNYRWQDDNGVQHTRTEIVANEMIILGDRKHLKNNDEHRPETNNDDAASSHLEPADADTNADSDEEFPF